MTGYTINMVTLLAIAVASGMVLDSGIVVLDNIIRLTEKGRRVRTAAIFGSDEMGLAITASTMTTIVVFGPLMFVGGIAGIIFRPLAFVIVVTLLTSLLTALMLTPMLASKWLKPQGVGANNQKGIFKTFYFMTEKGFQYVEEAYKQLLNWSLHHRKIIVLLSLVTFFFSMSFMPFISTAFWPDRDGGDIGISFRMEEGTRIEETLKVLELAMGHLDQMIYPEEMRSYAGRVGRTKEGISSAVGFEEGTNAGSLSIKLVDKDKRDRSVWDIAKGVREWFSTVPGISRLNVSTEGSTESAMGGGQKPIALEIQGYDLEKNIEYANELKAIISQIPGTADVSISQKDPRPEILVEVDRKKVSDLGLNVFSIAATLRNYFYGVEATEYRDSGEAFDIVTRFTEADKNNLENLENVPLFTMDGRMVKLKNVAKITESLGPIEIRRKNRQRIVTVGADLYKRSLGEVAADIETEVKRIGIPQGITVDFGGDVEYQREAFLDLTLMLVLGIVLVYMIMASLFGGLRDPFIVMFSVPFAFCGVVITYYITNTPLSLLSFMGLIMLMGIVVNNAIVLIHYILLLRRRGLDLIEAVSDAGKARLRPVLMTTLTTFFAMLPVAVGNKVGSEGWKSLGLTIIGGISFSTLITLLLVPTVYYLFERRKEARVLKKAIIQSDKQTIKTTA